MSRYPPPPPLEPFVQNNLEINRDMKSALDRPPVHKYYFAQGIRAGHQLIITVFSLLFNSQVFSMLKSLVGYVLTEKVTDGKNTYQVLYMFFKIV
jgi:hypothetical protein